MFSQALFFHLRTTKEDMAYLRKQSATIAAQQRALSQQHAAASQENLQRNQSDHQGVGIEAAADPQKPHNAGEDANGQQSQAPGAALPRTMSEGSDPRVSLGSPAHPVRQAWEHIEEVGQILKTAFPLLIMSLETIVDQINQRFKNTSDEEIYRLVCMLVGDGLQVRTEQFLFYS